MYSRASTFVLHNVPYRTLRVVFAILEVFLTAVMRLLPKAELLEMMKASLRDLDKLKLLSPNDLYILRVRRNLRNKIDELERQLQAPAA